MTVPQIDIVDDQVVLPLVMLLSSRRTVALTGAGISTESGIPDYRGPETRRRARRPMRAQQFLGDDVSRRRYWSRSAVGWQPVSRATPNDAHLALAALERRGLLHGVITQNVDGLHQRAGSGHVVELHGSLADVVCLACGGRETRAALQERLGRLNPGLGRPAPDADEAIAPDGDADIAERSLADFVVPSCLTCSGVLKPDVVFFGERVPKERVAAAWSMLESAQVLLVAGSSLEVASGYRFVRAATQRRIPVALVNVGPTRADGEVTVRVEGRLGDVLPRLARALGA